MVPTRGWTRIQSRAILLNALISKTIDRASQQHRKPKTINGRLPILSLLGPFVCISKSSIYLVCENPGGSNPSGDKEVQGAPGAAGVAAGAGGAGGGGGQEAEEGNTEDGMTRRLQRMKVRMPRENLMAN